MHAANRRTGPGVRLPQGLLDEINNESGAVPTGKHKPKRISRKESRRLERQTTKQKKQEFFSRSISVKRTSSRLDVEVQSEEPQRKKRKVTIAEEHRLTTPLTQHSVAVGDLKSSHDRKLKHNNSQSLVAPEERPVDVRHFEAYDDRNDDEDAYIAMLESKLGINKKQKSKVRYGAVFAEDNLIELLADLDSSSNADDTSGNDKTSKRTTQDIDKSPVEEAWRGLSPISSDMLNEAVVSHTADSAQYVPPQLRQLVLQTVNVDEKLSRHVKGTLNRLTEQNIANIIKDIEASYQKWTRHAVTSTLTTHIIESICTQSVLSDSYVALYASLVACLYKVIGIEFAANFLQQSTTRYEQLYNGTDNANNVAEDEKSCLNLMTLLAELYNFEVTSCLLMYDLVHDILQRELREIDIELLLKISRNSGTQLHKDDSSALDDIVRIVQSKLSTQDGNSSFRMRFLAETLAEVKNKKSKRSAVRNESEMTSRLKKFIRSLSKSHQVRSHEPLRVSLEDLRSAESRGKWWLVGAAWGGDPLMEHTVPSAPESEDKEDASKLWKVARKQGMNTDIRRSVFVILMSSDDYMDACDRLTQLHFNDIQQREYIRVLLHCCGVEKSYNPYYTLIGQELCRGTYSHKITLQYCLWDFLRDMGEKDVGGTGSSRSADEVQFSGNTPLLPMRISNLAKAFGWWIAKDSIDITCLKPLNFLSVHPQTSLFLEQLFIAVFISMQGQSPVVVLQTDISGLAHERVAIENVLRKCMRVPMLQQGIAHFLTADLSKAIRSKYDNSAFLSWSCTEAINILQSNYDNEI